MIGEKGFLCSMSVALTWMYGTDPKLVNDDHPSGKIWSVYVSEAEKEDKALVEGWKGDMEGLLIFVRNRQPSCATAGLTTT